MKSNHAQQIYLPAFDADFFRLPDSQQKLIEAKIDELGERLATFQHERLKGSSYFRIRDGKAGQCAKSVQIRSEKWTDEKQHNHAFDSSQTNELTPRRTSGIFRV